MSDIVSIGASNIDLNSYLTKFPIPGETMHGLSFSINFGGKASNQAVMAAKLGSSVSLISKVGTDFFGAAVVDNLKKNQVDCSAIYVSETENTGVAVINVDENGQNTIVITPGANNALTRTEILEQSDLLSKSKIILCQLEIKKELTDIAIDIAKKFNIHIIFNPTPITSEFKMEFLKNIQTVIVNEIECEMLTNKKIESLTDAKANAQLFLENGIQNIIFTLGASGCFVANRSHTELIAAPAVDVVDTVGAGDAFVGGFAHYLSEGLDIFKAARKSVMVASISVTRKGAQESYPNLEEVSHLDS